MFYLVTNALQCKYHIFPSACIFLRTLLNLFYMYCNYCRKIGCLSGAFKLLIFQNFHRGACLQTPLVNSCLRYLLAPNTENAPQSLSYVVNVYKRNNFYISRSTNHLRKYCFPACKGASQSYRYYNNIIWPHTARKCTKFLQFHCNVLVCVTIKMSIS